ncbi:hypothetical protein C2G38_2181609 [Gigaspora rosea]|uniref:Uncharacterized protein n=1 Tax=Gigaspora rosea TaxID=44941 RepID=A0A397VEX3_9GLOM|nr:hypothetical protein C2G38_2181609 [Gigaspora rosea]
MEAEIEAGHTAMIAFLQYAKQIYEKNFCSPNMHLHKHLRECMIDYGLELGSFSNSNRNMELEVLKNFNRQIYIQQIKAKAYHYLLQNFLSSLDLIAQINVEKTGSLGHYNFIVQESYQIISFMAKATLNSLSTSITSLTQNVNEMKTILNSSDIKSQLEITKNSIDSLKCRFDIYKQNQNEIATTI